MVINLSTKRYLYGFPEPFSFFRFLFLQYSIQSAMIRYLGLARRRNWDLSYFELILRTFFHNSRFLSFPTSDTTFTFFPFSSTYLSLQSTFPYDKCLPLSLACILRKVSFQFQNPLTNASEISDYDDIESVHQNQSENMDKEVSIQHQTSPYTIIRSSLSVLTSSKEPLFFVRRLQAHCH